MSDSYVHQLAKTLRTRTDELTWVFMEADARLALSREWTEEARIAEDPEWSTRFREDIAVLDSALQHVRSQLQVLLAVDSQYQPTPGADDVAWLVNMIANQQEAA